MASITFGTKKKAIICFATNANLCLKFINFLVRCGTVVEGVKNVLITEVTYLFFLK